MEQGTKSYKTHFQWKMYAHTQKNKKTTVVERTSKHFSLPLPPNSQMQSSQLSYLLKMT